MSAKPGFETSKPRVYNSQMCRIKAFTVFTSHNPKNPQQSNQAPALCCTMNSCEPVSVSRRLSRTLPHWFGRPGAERRVRSHSLRGAVDARRRARASSRRRAESRWESDVVLEWVSHGPWPKYWRTWKNSCHEDVVSRLREVSY